MATQVGLAVLKAGLSSIKQTHLQEVRSKEKTAAHSTIPIISKPKAETEKETEIYEPDYNLNFKAPEKIDVKGMATQSRNLGSKYNDFVKLTDVQNIV